MTSAYQSLLALFASAGVPFAAVALAQDISVNVPVSELSFYQNPYGLAVANGWGDPATGPHSNYIRMEGQSRSPTHVHTSSYYGVVVAGVVANVAPGAPDRPLPVGSYWYQKGEEPHVTACLSKADCVIFVTSSGPFDFTELK